MLLAPNSCSPSPASSRWGSPWRHPAPSPAQCCEPAAPWPSRCGALQGATGQACARGMSSRTPVHSDSAVRHTAASQFSSKSTAAKQNRARNHTVSASRHIQPSSHDTPNRAPAAMPPCALSKKSRRLRYTPLSICGSCRNEPSKSVEVDHPAARRSAGGHARQGMAGRCCWREMWQQGSPAAQAATPQAARCLSADKCPHLHCIKRASQAAEQQAASQRRVRHARQPLQRRRRSSREQSLRNQQVAGPPGSASQANTTTIWRRCCTACKSTVTPRACVFSSAMARAACSLVGASAGACAGPVVGTCSTCAAARSRGQNTFCTHSAPAKQARQLLQRSNPSPA